MIRLIVPHAQPAAVIGHRARELGTPHSPWKEASASSAASSTWGSAPSPAATTALLLLLLLLHCELRAMGSGLPPGVAGAREQRSGAEPPSGTWPPGAAAADGEASRGGSGRLSASLPANSPNSSTDCPPVGVPGLGLEGYPPPIAAGAFSLSEKLPGISAGRRPAGGPGGLVKSRRLRP